MECCEFFVDTAILANVDEPSLSLLVRSTRSCPKLILDFHVVLCSWAIHVTATSELSGVASLRTVVFLVEDP